MFHDGGWNKIASFFAFLDGTTSSSHSDSPQEYGFSSSSSSGSNASSGSDGAAASGATGPSSQNDAADASAQNEYERLSAALTVRARRMENMHALYMHSVQQEGREEQREPETVATFPFHPARADVCGAQRLTVLHAAWNVYLVREWLGVRGGIAEDTDLRVLWKQLQVTFKS